MTREEVLDKIDTVEEFLVRSLEQLDSETTILEYGEMALLQYQVEQSRKELKRLNSLIKVIKDDEFIQE